MIDFAADLAAIMEDGLAVDATLTAQYGDPVSIRVIPRGGDMLSEGHSPDVVPMAVFTTKQAGLSRPQGGAVLTIGESVYHLTRDAFGDARGLTWTMEARLV